MKKIGIVLLLIIMVVTLTACEKKNDNKGNNTSTEGHLHCERVGVINDESSAEMSYEIYYTNDIINRIESVEKVTSPSRNTLDTYENSYRTIHSYYEDVEYYETEVVRTDNTVSSYIKIDYDHVDINKLIEIEGTETNIFDENNKPSLTKYKELAKKAGAKCSNA
ncbi:MAG: DUF1307 domain-containing protein [Bacilli bacterium]|nr:DUF1307 domain-containing protein [Bacilli bacterium]